MARTGSHSWIPGTLALALLLPSAGGCFLFGGGPDEDDGIDRCDMDRYGCAEGVVTPDPQCMLGGELVAELGVGVEAFEPLAEGEAPSLYEGAGAFQGPGVTHTVLGVRIENAALDRYSTIGARFGIWEAHACSPDAEGNPAPCQGLAHYGSRDVVLGEGEMLPVSAGGAVEDYGITFVSDFSTERAVVAQVVVEDPCGRTGLAQHAFGAAP